MRNHDRATFKADAVKALLKEAKTLSQLAAELGGGCPLGARQLKEGKQIALQGLPELFRRAGKQASRRRHMSNLLFLRFSGAEVNILTHPTVQIDWGCCSPELNAAGG